MVLTSSYDANSRRTGLGAAIDTDDDFLNSYTYDNLGRLTRIEQTGQSGGNVVANKAVNFAYNAVGQFTTITRQAKPSNDWDEVATSTHTYDGIGRLTGLERKHGTTTIANYSWTYDADNRVTQISGPDGTSDYDYDNTSQLVGADHSYQTDESYSYDENGNRTTSGYDTGTNNQLLDDGTYEYEYDNEGNRTLRTHISSGAVTEYTWDYRNRLVSIVERSSATGPITKETTFKYDVFDRRLEKSHDADGADSGAVVIDRYVYDGVVPILQFDDSDNLTHRYLEGPTIEPILADEAVTNLASAGTNLWPLTDNLGTVRDLVNDSGTVQNHIKYDSFGNVTNESNAAVDFLFGYAAGIRDQETNLQYHRARSYDPVTGRWISEDPIGFKAGDSNLARYVNNDTANLIDPSGLESWHPPGTMTLGGKPLPSKPKPKPSEEPTGGGGTQLASLAFTCGCISQADSPAPGPADVIAVGVGICGLVGIVLFSEQIKLLTEWEIQKLKEAGYDPHDIKGPGGGKYDLYKDQQGNIKIKLKGGGGEGEDIGLNINDLPAPGGGGLGSGAGGGSAGPSSSGGGGGASGGASGTW